ncbi:MAG: ABC transporter ATP-binding protein [Syntrophobacterales bacterium]|nr:ABC transporter ATP-binding protein [Syntrophobacterales bacterium]
MTPLIRLVKLVKVYRPGLHPVTVLKGIDLEVAAGEFVAIMGPSGSGKSTLLYILGCLDRPTSGEYYLEGREVTHLSADELAAVRNTKLGIVFQSFFLLPRLTAVENVELPLLYADLPAPVRRRRALEVLELVGLADRAGHLPAELSGGEMQRVAIARALVNRPPLLLADEPTGNLDRANSHLIMGIFRELHAHQGLTLIMVTHDPEMAAYARRRLTLRDGEVVADEREGGNESLPGEEARAEPPPGPPRGGNPAACGTDG